MLEDNALISRIVSRFHIIVTVVVALLGAAFLGASAGEGDFFNIYAAIFGSAFIALMLALGNRYWMLIPISFTTQLPAVPIKGRMLELPEITAVLCSAVFLIRYAVKKQTFVFFRKEHAPVLLYVGWVVVIFCLNPVGLSSFSEAGASLGGARFYAKILLALASFIIMANQEMTDNDCKWMIILLLIGAFVESVYQIAIFFLPLGFLGLDASAQLFADPDSFYTWHQALAGVPLILVSLAFARFKTSELFSLHRLWVAVGFVLCVLLIAMSGKRAALAAIPMIAILASFLRREWGFFMLWLAGAVMAGTVIVIGHGDLFRFPLTVQRAFSALPAQWDSELGSLAGGKDLFRAELRRQAIKKIENDPWVGEGYQVNLSLSQALIAQYATRGGDTELQVAPFAMGSAWHNTWLGYAADFGIPAAMIAALIFFAVIRASYRLAMRFPPNSMRATLAAYLFLTITIYLVRSHTSGHSAMDAFGRWWSYGALVSLGIAYAKSSNPKAPGVLSSNDPSSTWGASSMPAHALPGSRPRGIHAGTLVGGRSTR